MSNNGSPSLIKFMATAPSNIAFMKYWGKRDAKLQWPANDSISMTLSASRTETIAHRIPGEWDEFIFDGRILTSRTSPDHKVFRHIARIRSALDQSGAIAVESRNTFPTGCGIASSASGLAALTLASCAALTGEASWEGLAILGMTREKLAHLARMGSGSAGRSLFGGYVSWLAGETPDQQSILQNFEQTHWPLTDVIVVFSDQEKHVSSSEAHLAAWASPLFQARLAGLPDRYHLIKQAIERKDIAALGREIESDALEMHAIAMTGSPSVSYFTDDTTKFVAWVRLERAAGRLPAWFTIDAGPNVHMICEPANAEKVTTHIKSHWPNATLLIDRTGDGPKIRRHSAGMEDKA